MISQIRVRMGEWDFSSTTEPNQHVERKVSCDWWRGDHVTPVLTSDWWQVVRKVVHPKYNFFTYENDLALVKTEKRVR